MINVIAGVLLAVIILFIGVINWWHWLTDKFNNRHHGEK